MPKNIGDIIFIKGRGEFYPGIECIVTELDENGDIAKIKAVIPDMRLAKHGFFIEGDDLVAITYFFYPN